MAHIINLNFNNYGTSESFNQQNYGIIPTGFTTSPTLNIINNTTVEVSIFTAYIKDSVKKLSVRIENDAVENISISSSTPYVIIRLTWANNVSNDFTYMNVAIGDIIATDLIIAKGIYTGPTLTSIDYSVRTDSILRDNGANISTIAYETNSDPTANNDGVDTAGLGIKFRRDDNWLNTVSKEIFKCVDNTTGNAVWKAITSDQALNTTDTPSFTGIYNKSGSDLRLYETDNTNYVGFKAGTLSADKIWTLPTADGTANQLLGTDGSGNLNWFTSGSTVFPFLPTTGLIMSNNSDDLTNDIDFTAGSCVDSTNAYIITVGALTKKLDATFTEGDDGGMLDTGSKANSTTYYLFAIGKTTDSNAGDILASTSSTSPSMPATWDLKKLIRVVKTDQNGVANIIENRNDQDTGMKFGEYKGNGSYAVPANQVYYMQMQCPNNTIINKIKCFLVASTFTAGKKCVVGIYSDNGSNSPGTLLAQSQEKVIQAADLATDSDLIFHFRTNVTLTADTKYWIAYHQDATQNLIHPGTYAHTGRFVYQAIAYSGTLPASATSGGAAGSYIAFQVF